MSHEIEPNIAYSWRPARVAFCCDKPTAAEILEVAALSFTIWGGRYNPIVDVAEAEEAESLVRGYNCDLLYFFHATEAVTSFASRFRDLAWSEWDGALTVDTGEGFGAVPVFYDLVSCSRAFIQLGEMPFWVQVPSAHPAFSMLALTYGCVPAPSARMPLDYVKLLSKVHLDPLVLDVGSTTVEGAIPIADLTSRRLRHQPVRDLSRGVVVGRAQDSRVLRSYWNARARGLDVTLLDSENTAACMPWLSRHLERFKEEERRLPYSVWAHEPDEQVRAALEAEISALANGERLSFGQLDHLKDGIAETSQVSANSHTTVLPMASFPGGRARVQFQPKQITRTWTSPSSGHVVLDVRGSSHPDQPRSATFRLPRLPQAAPAFARSMGLLHRDTLRTRAEGASLLWSATQSTASLRAVFGEELALSMFQAAGIEATSSDAGRYTDQVVRFLGGLQKARILKLEGARRVLEATADGATITTSGAKQMLRGAPESNSLSKHEDLRLYAGQGRLTNDVAWTYLLRKRVFLPGAQLKCEQCALPFWMSIDELRSVVSCPHCGFELVVAVQLTSPDWKYRRSPLFSVSSNMSGAVPVILTLQQLHTHFHDGLIGWSTSLNLKLPSGPDCETDFVAVCTHTWDSCCLVVGECKTNLEVDENDMRNLLRIRSAFSNTSTSVYIVFAKTSRFTETELQLVRAQDAEVREHTILFDVDDLESYEAFDEQSRRRPILDLRGLAEASARHHGYGVVS